MQVVLDGRGAQRARLRIWGHQCEARIAQRSGAGRARRGAAVVDGVHGRFRYTGRDG